MILRKFLDDEATVLENVRVASGVYRMTLAAPDIARAARPGQFVAVGLDPRFHRLRRPFGIADAGDDSFTIYYRVIGEGTLTMTEAEAGDMLSVLGPLGHGFDTEAERPLLVGGGMGLAPLLCLAKSFAGKADVIVGGRSLEEVFWSGIFAPHAREVTVVTDDGSAGIKGVATAPMPGLMEKNRYDRVYACGPEIMMRKVYEAAERFGVPCQVSLERRMACGLGACLSCACDTTGGRRKVCKDGPVFFGGEVFL